MNCNNGLALQVLQEEIVACRRCARLIAHCTEMARVKRRAFRDWDYWGLPVPSFGDPEAALLIVGLAPAAHGGNRTGRVFTGDRSGDLLYKVLYQAGFANRPESRSREDDLRLTGAWITATAHCAPPDNKPTPEELRNCRPWLDRELDLLPGLKVIVPLGKIAFDATLSLLHARGFIQRKADFAFGHNLEYRIAPGCPVVIGSYHPSQQNTSTGKLTERMLLEVFMAARSIVG
ncbi:MAG: uracil-DNA glycosylase [Acidobacteriota bacterium]|nr:uracil-DNA glycosylase [Acidobacteriota bacterium]